MLSGKVEAWLWGGEDEKEDAYEVHPKYWTD